ncbi:MAG: hypothetical protein COA58_04920 [Bacteroidetes bacterium]|nr:MAG: hypothetical protein COA58_04920 [Bacteroidota bacterium]
MDILKKQKKIIYYIVILYSFGCNTNTVDSEKYKSLNNKIVILKGNSLCTKCVSLNRTIYEMHKENLVVVYPSIREIEIETSNNLEFGTNEIVTYNDIDLFKKINELAGYDRYSSTLAVVSGDSIVYSTKYDEFNFLKLDSLMTIYHK